MVASAKVDILATVFFAAATCWLALAILYSLSVLIFIRMRSRGTLGSIYDEDFGRLYFCGRRCYIPMGFLFRRFVLLNRNDQEGGAGRRGPIRVMNRQERRQAMATLLAMSSSSSSTANGVVRKNSIHSLDGVSSKVEAMPDAAAAEDDEEGPATDPESDEEMGSSPSQQDEDEEISTSASTDAPSCSICLAEYGHDDDIFSAKTCSHRFHRECILDWLELRNNTECPCCRVSMVSEEAVWELVKNTREEQRRLKKRKLCCYSLSCRRGGPSRSDEEKAEAIESEDTEVSAEEDVVDDEEMVRVEEFTA